MCLIGLLGEKELGILALRSAPHLPLRHIKDVRTERKKRALLHLVWLLAPGKSTSQFECDIKRYKKIIMGMMIRSLMLFLRNVDADGLWGCFTRWEYEWLRLYSEYAYPHSFAGNKWRCSAALAFGVLGPVQRHLLKPPRHAELGGAAKWLEGHGWKCPWCLHSFSWDGTVFIV